MAPTKNPSNSTEALSKAIPVHNSPKKSKADPMTHSSVFSRTVRRVTEELPSGLVQKSSSLFTVLHSKKKDAHIQPIQEASKSVADICQARKGRNPVRRSLGQPDPLRSNGISLPQAQVPSHIELAHKVKPSHSMDSLPNLGSSLESNEGEFDHHHQDLPTDLQAPSVRSNSSSPGSIISDESSGSLRTAQWGIMVNGCEAVKARRQPAPAANAAQGAMVQANLVQSVLTQPNLPQASVFQVTTLQTDASRADQASHDDDSDDDDDAAAAADATHTNTHSNHGADISADHRMIIPSSHETDDFIDDSDTPGMHDAISIANGGSPDTDHIPGSFYRSHTLRPSFLETYLHFPPFRQVSGDSDVHSHRLYRFAGPPRQPRRVKASLIPLSGRHTSNQGEQFDEADTASPIDRTRETPPAPKKSHLYHKDPRISSAAAYAKKDVPPSRIPISVGGAVQTSSMINLSSRFSSSSSSSSEASDRAARPRAYRPSAHFSRAKANLTEKPYSNSGQHEQTPKARTSASGLSHEVEISPCMSGSPTPRVPMRFAENTRSAARYRASPTPGSRLLNLIAEVPSQGYDQPMGFSPLLEIRYPTTSEEKIVSSMPLGWWSGRLNSQMDKLRSETMLTRLRQSRNSESFRHVRLTGNYRDGFLDEESCKEYVMRMLREQCATDAALKSYNEFALFLSQNPAFGQRNDSPDSDDSTDRAKSLLPVRRSLFRAKKHSRDNNVLSEMLT